MRIYARSRSSHRHANSVRRSIRVAPDSIRQYVERLTPRASAAVVRLWPRRWRQARRSAAVMAARVVTGLVRHRDPFAERIEHVAGRDRNLDEAARLRGFEPLGERRIPAGSPSSIGVVVILHALQ